MRRQFNDVIWEIRMHKHTSCLDPCGPWKRCKPFVKWGRQCLVRRQCVKVTMQMQNNAKLRTSGRRLMACDLPFTAVCFCSGDLNRVGVSSCASVGEHMVDAKTTMQHTWHFLFLLLSTTWSGEWVPLQAFVKWAVSA